MNPNYRATAARAAHRCEYCRAPEVAFNFPFEVEHIVPPGLGGDDQPDNLALSCRACNIYKAEHLDAEDPATGETTRLFNPRIDNWIEHFIINADEQIVGRTSIGRATAALLRMNMPPQLEARRCWRTLQLLP